MSRRGSIMPNGKKGSVDSRKRVSLKDNTLSPNLAVFHRFNGSVNDVKDGEVYYKTVHIYPSIPNSEEVTVTVARHARDARAGSSAGHVDPSRRGSVYSERSSSPDPSIYLDRSVCFKCINV